MQIKRTSQFKKSYKRSIKANKDLNKLRLIIDLLVAKDKLPEQYLDHPLSGKYKGERELHIEPDWLLVYHYENDRLVLVLTDIGSHAYLF